MDKAYDHLLHEEKIYEMWNSGGFFEPTKDGKPYSIIMPPPNANGELHLGHATFVAVSDALARYHRMKGESVLWLPGVDHAGILSQVSFEKKLSKDQGKSRYDLGRDEFVRQCFEFCIENKHLMEKQLMKLGASCNWKMEKFTLDPDISRMVYETFIKMYEDGLVYRGYRIINWSTKSRSTVSDLETEEKIQTDDLFFLDYGYITIATTRPETIFADVAVAVHPKGKHAHLIGKRAVVPLINKEVEIIGDEAVDDSFGTGALKITPGHDALDFEIGQRHHLPIISVVDFDGKMCGDVPDFILGKKVHEARKIVAEKLTEAGKIVKIQEISHAIKVSERYGEPIEPLVSRQWFVKIDSLADLAKKAVETEEVKIIPKKYENMYFHWISNVKDWPISRQLWWGHRLPVWYRRNDQKTDEQLAEYDLLKKGDSRAKTDILESPIVSLNKPEGEDVIQDPDTFDTWFSSGQWPINTLKSEGEDVFDKFYPTSVLNTAYEILFVWVSRMIMFGKYLTGNTPFKTALINGVLRDETGLKMSKSKGNGVNPNEAIDQFGADAVRMALVCGRDSGNDLLISKQQMLLRIKGYRNFANKIWNIARFIKSIDSPVANTSLTDDGRLTDDDRWILKELKIASHRVGKYFESNKLGLASQEMYDLLWMKFADVYIESIKNRKEQAYDILNTVMSKSLKLLHPFMPFVTEVVWQELRSLNPKVYDSPALIAAKL